MQGNATQVAEYCQNRMGDDLRSVGYYSSDDFHLVYLRDDLEDEYSADALRPLIESARAINRQLYAANTDALPLGNPNASVHSLVHAFVMQFPIDEESGVFVTMSPDIGRDLNQFVLECRAQMTQ